MPLWRPAGCGAGVTRSRPALPAYGADLSTYGRTSPSATTSCAPSASRLPTSRRSGTKALKAGGAILDAAVACWRSSCRSRRPTRDRGEAWPDIATHAGQGAPGTRPPPPREPREIWDGTSSAHRDDVARAGGRDSSFASRGQQRTAILALKLAELDLLTALDGRPPLLLLDDVFSELDPARRGHLVRRIATLPQAFVTTTTLDDLDPALCAAGTAWRVDGEGGVDAPGARLVRATA
jgi:hypothetical protein